MGNQTSGEIQGSRQPLSEQPMEPGVRHSREHAMDTRAFWVPAIAVFCLVGTSSLAPALARGAANGSGGGGFPAASSIRVAHPAIRNGFGISGFPLAAGATMPPPRFRSSVATSRIVARHIDIQNQLSLHRRSQLQDGLPVTIWPYWSSIDTTPMEVPLAGVPAPSNQPVIVVSGLPNRVQERMAPETPPDYSYVTGCHAIPNGYHCDAPHNGPMAP
jgi:hypothetical protein